MEGPGNQRTNQQDVRRSQRNRAKGEGRGRLGLDLIGKELPWKDQLGPGGDDSGRRGGWLEKEKGRDASGGERINQKKKTKRG